MLPTLPSNDGGDCFPIDAELFGELSVSQFTVFSAYAEHDLVGKFSERVALSRSNHWGLSALGNHVSAVIGSSPFFDMSGIEASPVVADVDSHRSWPSSIGHLEG